MRQAGSGEKRGWLVLVMVPLALAGCDRDANSFRALNLQATAIGTTTTETTTVKALVVGDVASPRLRDFLDGKSFTVNEAPYLLDVEDVPYGRFEAAEVAMDGDYIVWSDNRNGNRDIFGYRISTASEFPISTAAGNQITPKIAGDYVVWEDYRNGNADIYAYQISTQKVFAVSTASRSQRYPQIDGDYVVWQDERNSQADIYAYRFSTAAEFVISAQAGDQWAPQIKGDYVVWQSYANGFSDIYAYRLSAATLFAVSTAPGSQYTPALSDTHVVWVDNRNNDDDIYAYELATGSEILVSNASGQQWRPRITGNVVVWQDYRNGNYDIFAYDLAARREISVTTAAAQQINPAVLGDTIVWQDFRDGNYDLYAYSLAAATETRLTSHVTAQTQPLLSGNTLVWLDAKRGVTDVVYRQGLSATDQLATNTWVTPAGAVKDLANYKVVLLGSDIASDEVMLQLYDAALAAKANVMSLGGNGTSLAAALASAGRLGLGVTAAAGCSPVEVVSSVTGQDAAARLFTDLVTAAVLPLELDEALTQDELAIQFDAANPASPADWDVWASFSGNMCNAAAPALVEFKSEGGSRVILDGGASTADKYAYWSANRWTLLSNAVIYLATD